MFSSLFGASKPTKNTLIIDIGSGSVGAGLVRVSRAALPTLLLSHRAPITMRSGLSAKNLADGAIAALRDALGRIVKMTALYTEGGRVSPQRVDDIVCISASPWYLPKTKLLRLSRERPFSLSHSLITKILREEATLLERDPSLGARIAAGDLELIERSVLTVALNGYETANIYADGILNAELGLFMSFMPEAFGKEVRRELERAFTVRPLIFHSFPLIFFLAVRNLDPNLSHSLLVDVSGEVTDVVFVERGMIRSIASFPDGKHTLRRTLRASSEQEGESLLRLRSRTPSSASGATAFIDEAIAAWRSQFSKAALKLLDGRMPPRSVYVAADDNVLPLYIKAVEEEPLFQAAGEGGVRVVGITQTLLETRCRVADDASPDAFLMLAGMVADSLYDRERSFDFLSTNPLLLANSSGET